MGITSNLPITVACDWQDVEEVLSHYAAQLQIDDVTVGTPGYTDVNVQRRILERAMSEWTKYTFGQFAYSDLPSEGQAHARIEVAVIAAYHASIRRGNSAPSALAQQYSEVLDWLTEVKGGALYPGFGKNTGQVFKMQNHVYDMNWYNGERQASRVDGSASSKTAEEVNEGNVNIPFFSHRGY